MVQADVRVDSPGTAEPPMSVEVDEARAKILATEILLHQAGTESIANGGDSAISNGHISYPVDSLGGVNDVAVPKYQRGVPRLLIQFVWSQVRFLMYQGTAFSRSRPVDGRGFSR
jgi:hypothetical protein